eukprot:scaffold45043_cov63-Phaeocystis_antarctica.AAC.6
MKACAPPVTLMSTFARGSFHTSVRTSIALSTSSFRFMSGILANLAGFLSVKGNVSAPALLMLAFSSFAIVAAARASILPRVPCLTTSGCSGVLCLARTGACATRRCADILVATNANDDRLKGRVTPSLGAGLLYERAQPAAPPLGLLHLGATDEGLDPHELVLRLAELGAQLAQLALSLRELVVPRAQRRIALLEVRRGALPLGHRLVAAPGRVSQRAGEDLRARTQHLLGEVHVAAAPLFITPRCELLAPLVIAPRHDETATDPWPRRPAVSSAGRPRGCQRPAPPNPSTQRDGGGGGRDDHQREHAPALRRQPNAARLVCAAPE